MNNKIIDFINKQFTQVASGGIVILLQKIRKILMVPLILPLILFIRILNPLLLLRFGPIRSNRIGHFVIDVELYLDKRDLGLDIHNTFDIFYYEPPICNRQMKRIWERILCICAFSKWIDWLNRKLPGGEKHIISTPDTTDKQNLLIRTKTHISFTYEEEERGWRFLKDITGQKKPKFVCFSARDSTYLNTALPGFDWSYHDYRDSNIDNYIMAAGELTKNGYFLFRMGFLVKEMVNINNPKIIDYTRYHRSDFLDIFLPAKCHFFLSDPNGLTEVPRASRRPIVYTNFIPLKSSAIFTCAPGSLFIPKKLWSREERRLLNFREMLTLENGRDIKGDVNYNQLKIEVLENTPEEITALSVEMDERLKGDWQETPEDEQLQQHFWSILNQEDLCRKPLTRIGAAFLRENRKLLEQGSSLSSRQILNEYKGH